MACLLRHATVDDMIAYFNGKQLQCNIIAGLQL